MRQSVFCVACLQGMDAFVTLIMLNNVLVTVICITCGLACMKLFSGKGLGVFGHRINELNGVYVIENKSAMSSGEWDIFGSVHLKS